MPYFKNSFKVALIKNNWFYNFPIVLIKTSITSENLNFEKKNQSFYKTVTLATTIPFTHISNKSFIFVSQNSGNEN